MSIIKTPLSSLPRVWQSDGRLGGLDNVEYCPYMRRVDIIQNQIRAWSSFHIDRQVVSILFRPVSIVYCNIRHVSRTNDASVTFVERRKHQKCIWVSVNMKSVNIGSIAAEDRCWTSDRTDSCSFSFQSPIRMWISNSNFQHYNKRVIEREKTPIKNSCESLIIKSP